VRLAPGGSKLSANDVTYSKKSMQGARSLTGEEHNSPKSAPTCQQPANGNKQPCGTMSLSAAACSDCAWLCK
jgi:hypothetical protein